ncbi:unnamed protein product [Vitrella brassicaformis CCMP3155]|uniref:SPRY domain-containing protein n=1 Tax=Vitrella brassicaformis (strain CCMP3155) TaxID=1169540 RepID=A0A0G4G1Y9_VITBC|nr:unnamed protein product [Vitrella brassicaformis CCMP3155]|mmetsp:Transcript_1063/g.2800  ORF Transcript_1063/g.2800 Transcript_1063/m.2800 type:complete len:328 (+) Transcript_1063:48-1031(+)|eukprot:CEM21980.1 unnamed protein product [Vitrella brassicaformis CCMP3155]
MAGDDVALLRQQLSRVTEERDRMAKERDALRKQVAALSSGSAPRTGTQRMNRSHPPPRCKKPSNSTHRRPHPIVSSIFSACMTTPQPQCANGDDEVSLFSCCTRGLLAEPEISSEAIIRVPDEEEPFLPQKRSNTVTTEETLEGGDHYKRAVRPMPSYVGSIHQITENVRCEGNSLSYSSRYCHRWHLTDCGGVQFSPPFNSKYRLEVLLATPPRQGGFMIGVAPEGVDLAKPNLEMSHGYFFFTKDQTLFAQDLTIGRDWTGEDFTLGVGSKIGIEFDTEDRNLNILVDGRSVGACCFRSGTAIPAGKYIPTILFATQDVTLEIAE